MKKWLAGLAIVTLLLLMNNCSTDVDLYAEYKDITIVYGLLDIDDDTAWLKITKAFTGPGDALIIAQNPDSSNYPYKLDVTLNGTKNGQQLNTIVFDTMTIYHKEAGDSVFYFPKQLVYYAPAQLDPAATYQLEINNKGNLVTSQTPLVGNFNVSHPNRFISFTNDGKIEWNLAENGKRYEVSLEFQFKEYAPGYADTIFKTMDWFIGIDKSDNGLEGYVGQTFYDKLLTDVDDVPNVERWADTVTIFVACGSDILNSYIDINDSENSLLTEVPVFSNIIGGTGIFASRHSTSKIVFLSPKSIEKLVEEYPEMGFKYPID